MVTDGYTIEYEDKINNSCNKKINEYLEILPAYCSSFIQHKIETTQPRKRLAYVCDIHLFLSFLKNNNPCLKKVDLKDISLDFLEQLNVNDFDEYLIYLSKYIDDNKNIHENSRSSKKRKLSSLKSFFSFLFNRDYISTNPCAKVDMPKLPRKDSSKIRILEDYERPLLFDLLEQELENAISEMENQEKPSPRIQKKPAIVQRDITIICLLLSTGIRVSELCAINVGDINFELNRINIIRKGGFYDDIYFSDEVKDLLYKYIQEYRPILSPNFQNVDALFISSQHQRITTRSIEKMLKAYTTKALGDKNGITPHKLRATFGTNYYKMTGDLNATKQVLGHSSIEVTSKYYTKTDESAKLNMKNMKLES